MTDRNKIKYWWSEDKKWFCILTDDGVSQSTVSLTPEEAFPLSMNAALASPSLTAGVENPDIGPETGNPEVDGLIHRLLDAQQDINFAANTHMDQSLCNAAALIDDVERYLRKYASAAPATLIEQSDSEKT